MKKFKWLIILIAFMGFLGIRSLIFADGPTIAGVTWTQKSYDFYNPTGSTTYPVSGVTMGVDNAFLNDFLATLSDPTVTYVHVGGGLYTEGVGGFFPSSMAASASYMATNASTISAQLSVSGMVNSVHFGPDTGDYYIYAYACTDYTCTTPTTGWWVPFHWDSSTGGTYDTVNTIGITTIAPIDQAIDVNAVTTFSGTYDNDGTYTEVGIDLLNMDCTNCNDNRPVINCGVATIGTGVPYSCTSSLSTSTHYTYNPYLYSPNVDLLLYDSEGYYAFTTGLVYEVTPPAISSTCGALDVGCYLQNAISWTFGLSQSTMNQFANLSLEHRKPFSYIYDMGVLYGEAFPDTTPDLNIAIAFGSFGNITLLSTAQIEAIPFQGLVRTIMGALMMFGTAIFLYKTILGVHDKVEATKIV